jgi:AmiR/NasT family two-component response regulator
VAAQAAIDQAVGAMTMSDGCTAAEALDTLRDDAEHRHVELSAAAAAYVRGFADGRPGSPDRPSPIGS